MQFIDTHIHLDAEYFQNDLPEVLAAAESKGVIKMIVPNVDSSTSKRVIDICTDHPDRCFPMMGLHPTSVKEDYEKELQCAEALLRDHSFVAVGEIGIDLYWDKTFFKEQQSAFIRQMHWAHEMKLPAVIHSRKSLEEIMALIKKEKLEDIRAVFHCFPGSVEQAKRLTASGYFLGIGGVVTFKNAGLAEVVKEIPLEFLLPETDAPWLAPVPFRGKRNEPAYLELIAGKIAEIKEIDLDEVAAGTTAAVVRLFPGIEKI
jgi:TatD DNase family protein